MIFRLITLFLLIPLLSFALEVNPSFEAERHSGAVFGSATYSSDRIQFQDQLALQASKGGRTSKAPRIIFTAGGYGAGKSTVLNKLSEYGAVKADEFLTIDCDEIKAKIPEFAEYLKVNPAEASTLVHSESMAIAQLAMERGMNEGKNIIFDSSLKYAPYYEQLIERIRKTRPEYKIEIIHVDAKIDQMLHTVHHRAAKSGRYLTRELVVKSAEEAKASVEKIAPKVDRAYRFKNSHVGNPVLESIQSFGRISKVNIPLDGSIQIRRILSIPDLSKPADKTFHIVFDIDNSIVNMPGIAKPSNADWHWVNVQGVEYRVSDHLGSSIQQLLKNPDVKISFSSGGKYERNYELLKSIKPPELGGKSLYDIAYRSLSMNNLKENFPDSKTFSKRWQKDLSLISPDLKNVVLIDDKISYIQHSGSEGIQFGKVYDHFDTWEEVMKYRKVAPANMQKWIPLTKKDWLRDRNRFARITAILEQAMEDVRHGSKHTFAELVGQYDRQPEMKWMERGLKQIYPKMNPQTCLQNILKQTLINP